MNAIPRPSFEQLCEVLGLQPLPVEGGHFAEVWRSEADGCVVGTSIVFALSADPDSFSAMHRLTLDEIWHFHLGDPIELLLLHPDGSIERPRLGPDLLKGDRVQVVVPAGTWMGGAVVPGGSWGLVGCTMAPGFVGDCFESGVREELVAGWPVAADAITRLTRPGSPRHMPQGY